MDDNFVTVIREGNPQNILENDLRKGDFVLIQTGDIVPADLKLIEARSLDVDEFDITGELMPVSKKISSEDVFVYMRSRVIRGSAKGVVIALGEETAYGNILTQTSAASQPQKLQFCKKEQARILILLLPAFFLSIFQSPDRLITILLFILAGLLLLFLQMDDFLLFLLTNHEQKKIEKRNILIRNRNIFPLLDQIDIACFDKTGVLTTRQIEITNFFIHSSLTKVYARSSNFDCGIRALIKTASALCTDISYFEKAKFANHVDLAFISFAQRVGVDFADISLKYRRTFDMPFDSEKRYMYCGYESENQEKWYFMKGDPDVVLTRCKEYYDENGDKKKLDFRFQSKIRLLSNTISKNGDTAIAMAVANGCRDPEQSEFAFLCLVQLENTLQEGAKEVVDKIIKKGIRPLLLTGDKPEAALKIAQDCGITQNSAASLTGNVIERMPLEEVGRQVAYCSVFSRLMPSQKASIIRQLQNKNHRVIMVGDGPNDGIALNVADIGISFQNDSSLIARRVASVLVNQLKDISDLIDRSNTLAMRTRNLFYWRVFGTILLLATIYIYAFY